MEQGIIMNTEAYTTIILTIMKSIMNMAMPYKATIMELIMTTDILMSTHMSMKYISMPSIIWDMAQIIGIEVIIMDIMVMNMKFIQPWSILTMWLLSTIFHMKLDMDTLLKHTGIDLHSSVIMMNHTIANMIMIKFITIIVIQIITKPWIFTNQDILQRKNIILLFKIKVKLKKDKVDHHADNPRVAAEHVHKIKSAHNLKVKEDLLVRNQRVVEDPHANNPRAEEDPHVLSLKGQEDHHILNQKDQEDHHALNQKGQEDHHAPNQKGQEDPRVLNQKGQGDPHALNQKGQEDLHVLNQKGREDHHALSLKVQEDHHVLNQKDQEDPHVLSLKVQEDPRVLNQKDDLQQEDQSLQDHNHPVEDKDHHNSRNPSLLEHNNHLKSNHEIKDHGLLRRIWNHKDNISLRLITLHRAQNLKFQIITECKIQNWKKR